MYIIGASGHAKVIIDALEKLGLPVEGVFDENEALEECLGYGVLRPTHFQPSPDKNLVIAIGNIAIRKKLTSRYGVGVNWGKVIHPAAVVSRFSSIGEGSVVMAGAVVQVDAKVGRHVIVNTRASIDHDCEVGDFSHIAPQAVLCGGVHVGAETLIGAGSVLTPGVQVGAGCVIGAGSVVLRHVKDGEKVYGIVK